MFQRNSSSGFGGNAITVKIKFGRRRPYLLTDWNHIRADTTRPLGEQHGQVSKKSDQWSRRRYDNKKKFTDRRTPDSLSIELTKSDKSYKSYRAKILFADRMTEPQNDGIKDMLKTVYPAKTSFCGGYKECVGDHKFLKTRAGVYKTLCPHSLPLTVNSHHILLVKRLLFLCFIIFSPEIFKGP